MIKAADMQQFRRVESGQDARCLGQACAKKPDDGFNTWADVLCRSKEAMQAEVCYRPCTSHGSARIARSGCRGEN